MMYRRLGRCFAAALLPITAIHPAWPQDVGPSEAEQQTQRIKDETAKTEAETARINAETAKIKAQVDALGLPKVEGKTELGADAGKLEGWMLATGAINEAARQIDLDTIGAKIALLDSDDILDVGRGLVLQKELKAVTDTASDIVSQACPGRANGSIQAATGGAMAAIGAVLSLLKSDTSISGFTIDNVDGALVNAIAATTPQKYFLPSELSRPNASSATLVALDSLILKREELRSCRAGVAAGAQSDAQKAKVAPQLAKLDAAATRADSAIAAVTDRKDGKPSSLEIALVGDAIIASHPTFSVLRVKVEKAGGSLLKRSNLFTALGAPAVGITGGLVVSWRQTDPATGLASDGGLLVCRTQLTNLNAIHAGRVRESSCGPQTAAPRATVGGSR